MRVPAAFQAYLAHFRRFVRATAFRENCSQVNNQGQPSFSSRRPRFRSYRIEDFFSTKHNGPPSIVTRVYKCRSVLSNRKTQLDIFRDLWAT